MRNESNLEDAMLGVLRDQINQLEQAIKTLAMFVDTYTTLSEPGETVDTSPPPPLGTVDS